MNDKVKELIDTIDPDKIQCNHCKKWFSETEVRNQCPLVWPSNDFKNDFTIAKIRENFECYKCWNNINKLIRNLD